MPRNMSFFYTQQQIRDRTKTVTRRLGWLFVRSGDTINACVKCQGLKPGKKVERMCQIHVLSAHREPLNAITPEDVVAEGFPDMTPAEFVAMFRRNMHCSEDEPVTRIEFEYMVRTPSDEKPTPDRTDDQRRKKR
jgi:hypothetical protein